MRIVDGPLTGLEGVLLQVKPGKGLLVVSLELLQRSVAVEVDCTRVVSIGTSDSAAALAGAPVSPRLWRCRYDNARVAEWSFAPSP